MKDTLTLAQALIKKPSITPDDAGCQQLIADLLTEHGFSCQPLNHQGTYNLYASHGTGHPKLLFAGHTDVVPPGDGWQYPAFDGYISNDILYGRGVVDMKGALAAMISAAIAFIKAHPNHPGTIAFAITSDEEGNAEHGTKHLVEQLQQQGEQFDYCLIGEPTSDKLLGDTLKIGRRGSLHCNLMIHGVQGHIAYPHLANNPIHLAAPLITSLSSTQWDSGNADFPPTQWQISQITAGDGTRNLIPGRLELQSNFRYSPESDVNSLQTKFLQILAQQDLEYDIQWQHSASPFYSPARELATYCERAVTHICNTKPALSTSGGTSDGRFLITICDQLVELGLQNATAHQANEHCPTQHLDQLMKIYADICRNCLLS